MYFLYEIATGKLISNTSSPVSEGDIPLGMAIIEILDPSLMIGTWNTETLSFDPYPIRNIVSPRDLLERFTREELIEIMDTSNTERREANQLAELFLLKLALHGDEIDLDTSSISDDLRELVVLGTLREERVEEILGSDTSPSSPEEEDDD